MFPDRVGRMVLDGVVSSYDYNNALGNGSLTDSQKALHAFYFFCAQAGPDGCALATFNSITSDVRDRVQRIVQSLYHAPLAMNSPIGPEVLTYSDLVRMLASTAYSPLAAVKLVAQILAAVGAGGGDVLNQLVAAYHPLQYVSPRSRSVFVAHTWCSSSSYLLHWRVCIVFQHHPSCPPINDYIG
jgi:hypothetical protein